MNSVCGNVKAGSREASEFATSYVDCNLSREVSSPAVPYVGHIRLNNAAGRYAKSKDTSGPRDLYGIGLNC